MVHKINKLMTNSRGEVSVFAVIITAGATIIASAFGALATVKSATSQEISNLEMKVEAAQKTGDLVTEREANHYEELSKQLDRIESKIDKIR